MKIKLVAGDLTTFTGEAVVNAANTAGLGGGGVDGAIHRAAGHRLLEACKALPTYPELEGMGPGFQPADAVRIPNGGAIPTPAFDMACKWIIHTVGPVWPKDDSDHWDLSFAKANLWKCYSRPALLAVAMDLNRIAFPAISTGVYGCPQATCASIALGLTDIHFDIFLEVTFYLYPAENLAVWQEVAQELKVEVE